MTQTKLAGIRRMMTTAHTKLKGYIGEHRGSANECLYLVQEISLLDYPGELYTWGYYSDLSKAIKLVEELKKSSDEEDFPSTGSLSIQLAPLNAPEFSGKLSELPKRYTLYKVNHKDNKTLVKNQEDWKRLGEENPDGK